MHDHLLEKERRIVADWKARPSAQRGSLKELLKAEFKLPDDHWYLAAERTQFQPTPPETTMSTDQAIEQEIQAKGKTAPRITPADIEANIVSEHYFTAEQGRVGALYASLPDKSEVRFGAVPASPLALITFCVLILQNGHRIVGVNEGPVSTANFDANIGRKLARQNALDQVWPLMGYALRNELARPVLTEADSLADLMGLPRPDHPSV